MNDVKVSYSSQETEIEWCIHGIFLSPDDHRYSTLFISDEFSFAETTWRLLLVSVCSDEPEKSKFSFICLNPCKYPVKYSFFLKNQDCSLEQLVSGERSIKQKENSNHLIELKRILQQRSAYESPEVITIVVKLEAEDFSEPKPKKLKKLENLSQNFHRLFTDQLNCDVIFQVKDKQYKAHRAVLIARSEVFATMFQHNTSEKQSGIIDASDCDPKSFQDFLTFLYCGKLEVLTFSSALNLYLISKKYNVQDLKTFCRDHLVANLVPSIWCDVYTLAYFYDDKKFLSATEEFFHDNFLQIFKTPEWGHFMKDNHQLACKLLKEIPGCSIVK